MAEVTYTGPVRSLAKDLPVSFGFENNGQYFEFVPRSVFEKGIVSGDRQYYFPSVLSPEFKDSIGANAQYVEVESIADQAGNKIKEDLKKGGFEDDTGYLFNLSQSDQGFTGWMDSQPLRSYEIGGTREYNGLNIKQGQITGLGSYEGQPVFTYDTAGSSEPIKQGWMQYNPETGEAESSAYWFIPGKENKFAKTLGVIGGGLIALGTAGLAGIGPLAAGSGAAAGGAAAGTAGAGTAISGAGLTSAEMAALKGAAYYGEGATAAQLAAGAVGAGVPAGAFPLEVGQTFTPAPKSFQEALPGLGVETQASAGGFTAAPGSFQAALPSLGIASAPSLAMNLPSQASSLLSTDNLSNALRLGNALMGQPQQQQGLLGGGGGGRQAGAVDYSGVLGLLAQQARTPGVSSLAAPAQLQPMYQPTLLPNVMSLLG